MWLSVTSLILSPPQVRQTLPPPPQLVASLKTQLRWDFVGMCRGVRCGQLAQQRDCCQGSPEDAEWRSIWKMIIKPCMNWRVNPSAVSIFLGGRSDFSRNFAIFGGYTPAIQKEQLVAVFTATFLFLKMAVSWPSPRILPESWREWWLFRDPRADQKPKGWFRNHSDVFFECATKKCHLFSAFEINTLTCIFIYLLLYIYIVFRGKNWNLTWTVIIAASGTYFFQLMPYDDG